MIEKEFLVYSSFVFENGGDCDCGFHFVDDPMEAEDFTDEVVTLWDRDRIEFYCPDCGKQLATLLTMEVDEDFESAMLKPFKDAGVPLPFDRLGEMEEIYSPETRVNGFSEGSSA